MPNKEKDYEAILFGVMHSVDKWFDRVDENINEATRAAHAREIALREIEKRDVIIETLTKYIKDIDTNNSLYSHSYDRDIIEHNLKVIMQNKTIIGSAMEFISGFENNKI